MQNMIKRFLVVALLLVGFSACKHGQHNQAQVPGINQEDERIWGPSREAEPKQLNVEYPADETGEVAQRIQSIRQKMFPE